MSRRAHPTLEDVLDMFAPPVGATSLTPAQSEARRLYRLRAQEPQPPWSQHYRIVCSPAGEIARMRPECTPPHGWVDLGLEIAFYGAYRRLSPEDWEADHAPAKTRAIEPPKIEPAFLDAFWNSIYARLAWAEQRILELESEVQKAAERADLRWDDDA